MRPLFSATLAFAIVVSLGTGCGDDDDAATVDPGEGDDPADRVRSTVGPLAGRTFLSESVTQDGQPRPLVPGTQIRLVIHEDDRLTASAGCNTLLGSVQVEADRLVVDELATTEMGCLPELHAQDEWLSAMLSAGPAYGLDGARLRLEALGAVIELVDREVADPDRPLDGTVWQLESLVDADAVSSVPVGTGATLQLSEGRAGVAVVGCNQGSARVAVGESELDFGPLAMTRMACQPPGSEVESAIVAVLEGRVGYDIEADVLTLTHPSGNGLILRAQ